jgi:hypothetical protein
MTDLTTMTATFKAVVGSLNSLGKVELVTQVFDLQSQMIELQTQNELLRRELADLKDRRTRLDALYLMNRVYYRGERANPDGPFCTACADARQNIVRLKYWGLKTSFECPECKNRYRVSSNPVGTED